MRKCISALLCFAMLFAVLCVGASAGAAEEDKTVIVIDPGHGGVEIGTAYNGIGEKVYTLQLGLLLRERLEASGLFTVYMTRTDDSTSYLAARGIYANSVNADVIISLHFDGSLNPGDNGVTVLASVLPRYALTELGRKICSKLSEGLGFVSNGVLQRYDNEGYYWNEEKQWDCKDPSLGGLSDYYGIPTWGAKFGIPALIIEHGYFTGSADRNIIFADGALEKMADADAAALIEYYGGHTHSYSASPVRDFPSNCMFTGKESYHCTVCGHRKNVRLLPPAPDNHYWVEGESRSPECGVDGYVTRQCRITQNLNDKKYPVENHTETVSIKGREHSFYVSASRQVSHAVDGFVQYTCSYCGYTYKEIQASEGHSWILTDEAAPTCTENGYREYTCGSCGEKRRETVNSPGHRDTVLESTAPTCTEPGYIKKLCGVCGSLREEYPAPAGHEYRELSYTAASCTEDGEKTTVCDRCGAEERQILPKTGHSMSVTRQDADCENDGFITEECAACGYSKKQVIPARGHSWEAEEIITPRTVFGEGRLRMVCRNDAAESCIQLLEPYWAYTYVKISVLLLLPAAFAAAGWALASALAASNEKSAAEREDEPAESIHTG